jgi:endoglucanase
MQFLSIGPPSWQSVGALALWTYAMGDNSNQQVANSIREASLKAADQIVERTKRKWLSHKFDNSRFHLGSNGMAANYGVQLLVANWIRPNPRYVQTAAENLHYLLGRNTFSLSFVTQVGDHPFHKPHHARVWQIRISEPWPGLLSGGPNRWRQDPAMKKLPTDSTSSQNVFG